MLILEKLECVVERGGKIVAACPACRDEGQDRTGNHLAIFASGQFGCIRFPGGSPESVEHRKIIARLAGDGQGMAPAEPVPEAFLRLPTQPKIENPLILGRFGRSFSTYAHAYKKVGTTISLKQPSEASEDIVQVAFRIFGVEAVWDDPDGQDFDTWNRLRLIEGILGLRDGKGRVAYTGSQIDSCIIALRGFAREHPKNDETLRRLEAAKKSALTVATLVKQMTRGHRA